MLTIQSKRLFLVSICATSLLLGGCGKWTVDLKGTLSGNGTVAVNGTPVPIPSIIPLPSPVACSALIQEISDKINANLACDDDLDCVLSAMINNSWGGPCDVSVAFNLSVKPAVDDMVSDYNIQCTPTILCPIPFSRAHCANHICQGGYGALPNPKPSASTTPTPSPVCSPVACPMNVTPHTCGSVCK